MLVEGAVWKVRVIGCIGPVTRFETKGAVRLIVAILIEGRAAKEIAAVKLQAGQGR